jgi:hypothetical protein
MVDIIAPVVQDENWKRFSLKFFVVWNIVKDKPRTYTLSTASGICLIARYFSMMLGNNGARNVNKRVVIIVIMKSVWALLQKCVEMILIAVDQIPLHGDRRTVNVRVKHVRVKECGNKSVGYYAIIIQRTIRFFTNPAVNAVRKRGPEQQHVLLEHSERILKKKIIIIIMINVNEGQMRRCSCALEAQTTMLEPGR